MTSTDLIIAITVLAFFTIGYHVEKKLFERRNQKGDDEIWPF
jgi:hypothetical protein